MTAATTSVNKNNKKSFFFVRLKSKFSEDMKLFITNLVFQLLCLPVIVGVLLRELYLDSIKVYDQRTDCIPFIIIAVIAFILSVFMGLVIPMMNFRYLYSKSLVDMNYSLPLNNRQRFFADFSSGLITYIAPFLIGAVIALIELLIGSCFIEMEEVMKYLPRLIQLGTIFIVGLIMLYSISVFAMTFAGSIFEALFSIVTVNIMIPVFILLTWMNIVSAAHYGLTSSSVANSYIFFTTSPIGIFVFIIQYLEMGIYTPSDVYDRFRGFETKIYTFTDTMYFSFMLRAIFVIALIIAITFLLYKHRKAEDVSKPYVYKAFYYIIMSAVIYSIVTIMKMTEIESGLIAALVISGIIWFVMEVIRRRGFKRFWTALISFAAASAAVIGVIKVIDTTKGLGRAEYIPSASSVTDLEIDIWGYTDVFNENIVLHDPKTINKAIELNKELVDRHFDYDKYDYELSDFKLNNRNDYSLKKAYNLDEQQIKLTYYTKSGSATVRQYTIPSEMLTDLCCEIYTSKEYAEKETKEMYYNSLRDSYDEFYARSVYSADDAVSSVFTIVDKLGSSKYFWLTPEEGKELTDALCKDYSEMSSDDFKSAEYYCRIDDMIINSSCHNTVSFLEEHDTPYIKSAKKLLSELDTYSSPITIITEPEYVFPIMLFKDENYENYYSFSYSEYSDKYSVDCIKLDSILSLGLYRNRSYVSYGKNKRFEFNDNDAVEKLIEAATPVVTGEKILAEVQVGSITLYITDKTGNDIMIEKAKESIKIIDNNTGEEYNPDLYYQ